MVQSILLLGASLRTTALKCSCPFLFLNHCLSHLIFIVHLLALSMYLIICVSTQIYSFLLMILIFLRNLYNCSCPGSFCSLHHKPYIVPSSFISVGISLYSGLEEEAPWPCLWPVSCKYHLTSLVCFCGGGQVINIKKLL